MNYTLQEYVENNKSIKEKIESHLKEYVLNFNKGFIGMLKIEYILFLSILFIGISIIGIKHLNAEPLAESINNLMTMIILTTLIMSLSLLYYVTSFSKDNKLIIKIDVNGKNKSFEIYPKSKGMKRVVMKSDANYNQTQFNKKPVEILVNDLKNIDGTLYYFEAVLISELVHGTEVVYRLANDVEKN